MKNINICQKMLLLMLVITAIPLESFAETGTLSFNITNTTVRDTFISSKLSNQNKNYGAYQNMQVGGDSESQDNQKTLLYFDVSSLANIPNRVITSVTLKLYRMGTYSGYQGGIINIGVYKILPANADWVEGIGYLGGQAIYTNEGTTWNFKNQQGSPDDWVGSTLWADTTGLSTQGVDYESQPLADFEYNTGTDTGYVSIDLPPLVVEEWITQTNAGLVLQCDTIPELDLGIFKSSDWGADYPTLVVNYVSVNNCSDVWQAGLGIGSDINKDCSIDMEDFSILSEKWLNCNNPRKCGNCPDMPIEGISTYFASAAPVTVVIDGDLSEWPAFDYNAENWCGSKWIKIDKEYYDFPMNYSNAYMCMMYNASEDLIYAAVIVDDSDPVYWDMITPYDWDAQDNIEVFIQGNYYNRIPFNPKDSWSNAQQFAIGLTSDGTTWSIWPTGVPFGGYSGETGNPGVLTKINQTTMGSQVHMVYEMKLIPYDNYGGINGTTTVITDLTSGSKLGFDITLSIKNSGSFGMVCPNTFTGKSENVSRYSLLICE